MRRNRNHYTNKGAALVLALAMAAGSITGCGGSTDAVQTEPTTAKEAGVKDLETTPEPAETNVIPIDWEEIGWKADPENLEWKQDISPVKLSYYANFSWFSLNWEDDTAKRVTEKTGVDLEFSKPVVDDNQKLNMMIAGNQLPDIMTLDRNDPAIQTMIDAGMLWSLDELMDQHAPLMREIMPKEVMENYKQEDGKTYQFTTWIQGEAWQKAALKYDQMVGTNQPMWSIRKDYYEEIGSPQIKTAAEFITALEQIKANHPDKIGFYPADNSMSSDYFASHADLNNVGVQFGLSGDKVLLDGKVQWAARDPKFLETVRFMNELYKKDLLTKDPFIDSKDVAKAKIEKGDVISFSWTISDGEKVPGDNPNTSYMILPPLDSYEQTRTGAGWMATVIPKTCKDPERAIRFLEYLASVEGNQDVSWGIYGNSYGGDVVAGAHWEVKDGKPTMIPEYVVDKKADWGGVASRNGLGEYWIACNELLWNLPWWDTSDEKMAKFNEMFGSKIVYKPELEIKDPDPSGEEGIILQKAGSLLQQYSVKIIFADDVEAEYNKFISDIDSIGMGQVEDYWNGIYTEKQSNKEK